MCSSQEPALPLSQPQPGPLTFTVPPANPNSHNYTFILLHGLGSNGESFGTGLLEFGLSSSGKKLSDLYPTAKFIFPTSSKRRSTAFRRSTLHQWFDIASLSDPSYHAEVQIQGLIESAAEIRAIVDREADAVGKENVILGGLSQGCAMALVTLLSLEFPIGGFVGLSGWLPWQAEMEKVLTESQTHGSQGNEDGILFGESDSDSDDEGKEEEIIDPCIASLNFLRELLELSPLPKTSASTSSSQSPHTSLSTPIFLAHGEEDEKINVKLGQEALETMSSLGFQTTWKSYPGLGHDYKIPEEVDDVVDFLRGVIVKDGKVLLKS